MVIDTPPAQATVPLRITPAARSRAAIEQLRPEFERVGIPLPRNTDYVNVATLVAAQDKGVNIRDRL